MFAGMLDVGNTQSVVASLGQAPLDAIGRAVGLTRTDLMTYRSTLPAMAARHSQRGILNWVHDQFFAHVRGQFETDVEGTQVLDREPTRDIFVGENFRLRFKKHGDSDLVSSYPTTGYLDFVAQDVPQLIQEIRLIGGYRWDPETRELGAAVLSARDGRRNVLWVLELAEATTAAGVTHFRPQQIDPNLPALPQIVGPVEIEKDAGAE